MLYRFAVTQANEPTVMRRQRNEHATRPTKCGAYQSNKLKNDHYLEAKRKYTDSCSKRTLTIADDHDHSICTADIDSSLAREEHWIKYACVLKV